MKDKTIGLYTKYLVRRTDGRDQKPSDKHHDCDIFVLDVTHDPFAVPALAAYAESCKAEYPTLAKDIRQKLAVIEMASRNEAK